MCEAYPAVARAMLDAGWEFMGHGVVQGAMHLLPDQRAAIREAVQILQKFTGRKPKGWLGPGLTETWETLDLLAEEGIEYVSDWVNDDQPYEIRTTAGPPGVGALHGGAQRHPHDGRPAPRLVGVAAALPGPVRSALRGRRPATPA